jgi:hypothetical protein
MDHRGKKLCVLRASRSTSTVRVFGSALLMCAVPTGFAQQTTPATPKATTNAPATVPVHSSALIVLPATPPPPARAAVVVTPAVSKPLVTPQPSGLRLKSTGGKAKTP